MAPSSGRRDSSEAHFPRAQSPEQMDASTHLTMPITKIDFSSSDAAQQTSCSCPIAFVPPSQKTHHLSYFAEYSISYRACKPPSALPPDLLLPPLGAPTHLCDSALHLAPAYTTTTSTTTPPPCEKKLRPRPRRPNHGPVRAATT